MLGSKGKQRAAVAWTSNRHRRLRLRRRCARDRRPAAACAGEHAVDAGLFVSSSPEARKREGGRALSGREEGKRS